MFPLVKNLKILKTKIIKNELYIGGPTLCEGYIIEDQNKKAFVTINKQKFYKTNDIVKKLMMSIL